MVGVTDYDRVDRGSGETLSSLGIGGKVFSEVAKRLQMMWARKMIREKLRDEKHTGRNHMLFDFDRAGITIAEKGADRPRWVARIGVTRSTEACFLTADRQCTELPLLRLPRLVPEVVGCYPCVPRDLARVGWRGLAARKGCVRSRSP